MITPHITAFKLLITHRLNSKQQSQSLRPQLTKHKQTDLTQIVVLSNVVNQQVEVLRLLNDASVEKVHGLQRTPKPLPSYLTFSLPSQVNEVKHQNFILVI